MMHPGPIVPERGGRSVPPRSRSSLPLALALLGGGVAIGEFATMKVIDPAILLFLIIAGVSATTVALSCRFWRHSLFAEAFGDDRTRAVALEPIKDSGIDITAIWPRGDSDATDMLDHYIRARHRSGKGDVSSRLSDGFGAMGSGL